MKEDSALLLRQLLQLQQKMERMEQAHCAAFGISVLQSRMLGYIQDTAGEAPTAARIAFKFKLSGATVSTSLSNLKAKGLVHESPVEGDGRKKSILLSPRGAEVVQHLDAYLLPVATLFDQTAKPQKQQLSKSLHTLLARLDR